jgi:hypothetical protein
MSRGQTINSGIYTKFLKPCRRLSGNLDLTSNAESFFQHDDADPHNFENTGNNTKSDGLFFPTHHAVHNFLPQVSTSLEPSNMPFLGKRFEETTKLLKK